jgi:hypothetical protein
MFNNDIGYGSVAFERGLECVSYMIGNYVIIHKLNHIECNKVWAVGVEYGNAHKMCVIEGSHGGCKDWVREAIDRSEKIQTVNARGWH